MATPYPPPPNYPPPPRSIPGTVMAACILWIIYGALALIAGLASVAMGAKGGGVFQIFIGAAFLITGIQVLLGKASQILASGIVCIVLGAILILVVMSLSMLRMPGFVIAIVTVNNLLLITSGILACVGNTMYKRWRAGKYNLPFPG